MIDYTAKLELAIRAAVAAGNRLYKHTGDTPYLVGVRKESFRDIATEADISAETKIIQVIREHDSSPILSEEAGSIGELSLKNDYWVIDPLDGTVNYTHNMPLYAVSIAYMEKGVPVLGVIYNPSQNELFYGASGLGVYKNHNRINIVDRDPENSLFAMSFSGKKHNSKDRITEFDNFREVNDQTMGCLRTGSAALNLAYLAEGRLGGCMGGFTKIWDVAAGFVIADLAGAKVHYKYDQNEKFLVNYVAVVSQSENFLMKFLKL